MIFNRIISGLVFACLTLYPTSVGCSDHIQVITNIQVDSVVAQELNTISNNIHDDVIKQQMEDMNKLPQEDVDLISRVVMAEAEDEPMEGKIYVIDTILNRVDSKHFPKTVRDVVYQQSQFTSMWNGRYARCNSNNQLNDIINKEYKNRSNSDIVFFTADHYGKYGKPSFVVGNHYFSNYQEEL